MSWGTFLVAAVGPLAKKVLIALGLGFISYAGLATIGSQISSMVIGNYNSLAGDLLQMINLSGFGQFLGLVLGAFTAKIAMTASSFIGRLAS
jgi:hypothetical protein